MSLRSVLQSLGIEVSGDSAKILCPWHLGDKDPSLSITFDAGVFFCFGCGERGDEVKLISKLTGKNDLQALMSIGSLTVRSNEVVDKIDQLDDAHEQFYSLSKPSWDVIKRHYMIDERGISNSTLRHFDVRINASSEYPIIWPVMEGRVFKGYVTRRIDKDEPKYLYNKGFARRSTVFGKLKPGIVMVVEGSLDLMSAIQFGFRNTCCTLGAKVTEEQAGKIRKGADVVICAFDNDRAGEEGFYELKQSQKHVVRLRMPKGVNDVNEMTKDQFWNQLMKLPKEITNGRIRRH